MFSKSIDSKSTYIKDGVKIKDLSESIFVNSSYNLNFVYSYYRVAKDLCMRPDKISKALYGTDEYAEIVMKHSIIDNPFSVNTGDVLEAPSLSSTYANIKTLQQFENGGDYTNDNANVSNYDLIKNYHKYIDKSKVPETDSDIVGVDISKDLAEAARSKRMYDTTSTNGNTNDNSSFNGEFMEANLANNGQGGITISNGRIYFGKNVSASTDNLVKIQGNGAVDSSIVDCAKNGVTLGQFLNAVIKNNA